MVETSQESIIMTLLEQIRSLEDDRDKALKLAEELNRKNESVESSEERASSNLTDSDAMESVLSELEEIRLNEEQRQFNLAELKKNDANKDEEMDNENYKEMLEMCKKYYGKMVIDLQQEKSDLQKKVEKQQRELLEKDMVIAELNMKLGKHKS